MGAIRSSYVTVVAIFVAGCAIHPLPENVTDFNTAGIVEKIFCETRAAIKKYDRNLLGYKDKERTKPVYEFDGATAVFEFDFIITINNDATAEASFVVPISQGTFSIAFNGGTTKQRKADRQAKIAKTFGSIRKLQDKDCARFKDRISVKYPITGNIGMEELVRTFFELKPKQQLVATYRDKLSFTTTFNGSVNPSITLLPSPGKTIKAAATLAGDRSDLHQVTVQLSRAKTIAEKVAAKINKLALVQNVPGNWAKFLGDVYKQCKKTDQASRTNCKKCFEDLEACYTEKDTKKYGIAPSEAPEGETPPAIVDVDPLKEAVREFDNETNLEAGEEVRDLLRERP